MKINDLTRINNGEIVKESELKDKIDEFLQGNVDVESEIYKLLQEEVLILLVNENDDPISIEAYKNSKKFIIPVFTDLEEFNRGIVKLNFNKLNFKTKAFYATLEVIKEYGKNQENFEAITINPHFQNYLVNKKQLWFTMRMKDYETYKESGDKIGKSKLKDFINTYAEITKKIKDESSIELDVMKENIKETYPTEVYLTLIDEKPELVRFNVTERSKEYFIPVFTDIKEFDDGCEKISKLFLDKLEMKLITPEDIKKLASKDDKFKGIIINPHSQNFSIDLDNLGD